MTPPFSVVVAATLATGLVAGLINGLLVTAFRIPSLIATLGMLGIARALATFDKSRVKSKHDSGHFRALTPAYASPEMLQGGDDVLGGTKGAASYVVYARRLPSGNTEVDLVTSGE